MKKRKENLILFVFMTILILLVSYVSFSLFNSLDDTKNGNTINTNNIIFSYEEQSNTINITNAIPISDEIGMNNEEDGKIFKFKINLITESNILLNYEINILPIANNTLDSKYVKIYLKENNDSVVNPILINKLSKSKLRENAMVLYKNTIQKSVFYSYTLYAWVDEKYVIDNISRNFNFVVNVDGYLE